MDKEMTDKQKQEYFEFLINEYDEGRASVKGNHPDNIKTAVDTFFKAGKILVDNPEIDNIPQEDREAFYAEVGELPPWLDLPNLQPAVAKELVNMLLVAGQQN